MNPVLLSPCEFAIPARFLPFTDELGTILVQETPLTNHQFDRCRKKGAGTPYGLVGPSGQLGALALLARGGDPEVLLRKVPRQASWTQYNLTKLHPGHSITVGAHTLFHVTDQNPPSVLARPNQARTHIACTEALWAYDLMIPGARLLTHTEWDRVSGVTEGIRVATQDGTLKKSKANIDKRHKVIMPDVGSYPSFRGWYDLIGNVWEWVLPEDSDEEDPGLRGWSWYDYPNSEDVSAFRRGYEVGSRSNDIGARGVLVPGELRG